MKARPLFLLAGLFMIACSGHKNERELSSMPAVFTGTFQAHAGENLTYRAYMGFIRLGELKLQVSPKADSFAGRPAWCIRADGASSSGLSWLSSVEHHWISRIDSAGGISLFTSRKARENRYQVNEEVEYFPDSSLIRVKNLKKNTRRDFSSEPSRMADLINLMWKMRYTDFERFRPGDTLYYTGFHDGEWLAFRMCLAGKTMLGSGKKKKETWELFPVGLATTFLRGENPGRVWIETAPQRRPLKARLATYFGNFTVELEE